MRRGLVLGFVRGPYRSEYSNGGVEIDIRSDAGATEGAGCVEHVPRCGGCVGAYSRSGSRACDQQTFRFESAICLRHGPGGDAEVVRELTDRGKPIAGGEVTGSDEAADLIADLFRRRCRPGKTDDHSGTETRAGRREGTAVRATVVQSATPAIMAT